MDPKSWLDVLSALLFFGAVAFIGFAAWYDSREKTKPDCRSTDEERTAAALERIAAAMERKVK